MKDLSKRMDEIEDDKGGEKMVLPTPKKIGKPERRITERASSMIDFKNDDLVPERQKSRQHNTLTAAEYAPDS